jgi:predicted nucleotidyltransferase
MLNNDYKEMLQCLNAEGVEYLLVGAYALAAHGFPRATMDIDIWIKPSPENAKAVWKALERFGAPLQQVSVEDFQSEDIIFQIGVAPRRIDIITGVSALNFDETLNNAEEVIIEGVKILIPSVADLITNKRATGRTKDLADVETLETLTKKP